MFKTQAPYAHRLARSLKVWHAIQGDPLSLSRCQHIVAVVHGHANWAALLAVAAINGEPDLYTPEIGRFKQLGYQADVAERLVVRLSSVPATDDAALADGGD